MKRSEIVWAQATASVGKPPLLRATITDKDGVEWLATITHERYSAAGGRLTVTLLCRSVGGMHSTNALTSVNEAHEWCYQTLGVD
jgi:hypothetical protein